MWNTITIQYNPLIEEEWDEHFKVKSENNTFSCQRNVMINHFSKQTLFQITCEYGYDFWKTVTFPFLEVE